MSTSTPVPAVPVVTVQPRDDHYPERLLDDPDRPDVLYALGSLELLVDQSTVAIVGTRRCTRAGAEVAAELGRDLTEAGVLVVSGLALGIDGAAHQGVLDAGGRPVGVVASGLDVVYPSRHRRLWTAVGEQGLLLSEVPLGTRPVQWRFPARNRIIAALAHVVVVVESHVAGGSLHTVREAEARGIDVMAVPGSVRNPAAAGTNQLLSEGCAPARDATDVLLALGLGAGRKATPLDPRPRPDATGEAVLAAFDWEPATLDQLAIRTGLGLPALAPAIEALLADRWIQADGTWFERVAP